MLGRDGEYVRGLERAHYSYSTRATSERPAERGGSASTLLIRGEVAPRVDGSHVGSGCSNATVSTASRGYLRLAEMLRHFADGDFEAAHGLAAEAVEIGERFGDRDLVALGVMDQGHALLELGRTKEGLRLVDESMIAVTTGSCPRSWRASSYCNTIAVCQGAYELRRAGSGPPPSPSGASASPTWWPHTGVCLVHRAEIMQLHGAWQAALDEARSVETHAQGVLNRRASARALYLQGELHRLRGDDVAAEEAYRTATRWGEEPQPGMALLRLAQGNKEAALAAIRRIVGETRPPLMRAALLPAYVEIALAAAEIDEAERASKELAEIARAQGSDALGAMSAHSAGAVALAQGDAAAALTALRQGIECVAGARGAVRSGA